MNAAFAREGGYGAPASVIAPDSASLPHDAILVPDAQLLFTADFRRAGPDLILIGHDGRHHVIPNYFASEHPRILTAPNGASLSADVVALLAGSPTPNEYAQAGTPTAPQPIGEVEKVVGNVTVIRNGVAIALNVGDKVYNSDVIQTGADSQAGIGFPDGTALNLVANTRMALSDFSFDPNSTSNVALINLVEGTFSFVAGKVAHTGNMKIETPVATMGIRGTTGWVQEQIATISANVGNVTYSFAVTNDYASNQSGMYDLIDQNGNVIATVSQTGYITMVTPQGIGQTPSVTTQPMTAAQLQYEQQIVQEVFQTLNLINNPNPQTNPNGGSSTPPPQQNNNNDLQQLLNEKGSPFDINTGDNGNGSGTTTTQTGTGSGPNPATPTAYWLYSSSGNWSNPLDWSDSWAPLAWQTIIITQPATVTIDSATGDSGPTATAALNLLVGLDAALDIVSGGSLTVSNIVDVFGTIDVTSTGADPSFTAQGAVTVNAGAVGSPGEIEAVGSGAAVYFSGSVDNFGLVAASESGSVWFDQIATTNEAGGQILAQSGGGITFAQGSLDNSGSVTADNATILFEQTAATNESGASVVSQDGGVVTFDQGSLDNFGAVFADGGTLSFEQTTLTNEAGGLLEASNAGTLVIDSEGGVISNIGTIAAQNGGAVQLEAVTVDNAGAIELNSTGAVSTLEIGGSVTLEGGGTVTLSDSSENFIVSDGSTALLTNVDNTISGAGTIGDSADALFTLVNEQSGVIDATGTNALVIDNDSPATGNYAVNEIVNSGTIEATGTGGLTIENTTIDNSTFDPNTNAGVDGYIEASADSQIQLDDATILKGFVSVAAGAELETVSGSSNAIETANGPAHNTGVATITNAGTVLIDDNSSLALQSPYDIENTGKIELDSTAHQTFLYFNQPYPILSGGGSIVLEGGAGSKDIIDGLPGQGFTTVALDNQNNTISGAGAIGQGDGALRLQNDGLAFIDANLANQTLTIDTGNTVTNTGALEATSGGILALDDSVTDTGGTIAASGTGSIVQLNGATITGGTITDEAVFEVTAGSAIIGATINNGTSAVNGGVTIDPDKTLTLDGNTTTNTDTAVSDITFNDIATDATLSVDAGTVTLTGVMIDGGTLDVASGATLDLYNTEIVGVDLSDLGTINIFGSSTVDSFASVFSGLTIVASGQTLFLDNAFVTGKLTNDGTLQIDPGDEATFSDVAITSDPAVVGKIEDYGNIDVTTASSVAGSSGYDAILAGAGAGTDTVTLDAALTLDYVALSGITIETDSSLLPSPPQTLTIDGAVEVAGATTLADLTVSGGTITVDSGETLTLSTDTLDGVTLSGGTDDVSSLTIGTSGEIENATVSGGTITVDTGETLTLSTDTLDGVTLSGGTDDVTAVTIGTSERDRERYGVRRHHHGGRRRDADTVDRHA